MNEEERKSIKNLKKYIEEDVIYKKTLKYYSDFDKFCYNHCKDIDTVLILVEKLQKENEQLHKFILEGITIENSPFQNYQLDFLRENFIPIQRIENLIKELKQDDINITKKYKEKKNITGELLSIDKVRVRAYREKTREINEKLHKLLIETIETKGE